MKISKEGALRAIIELSLDAAANQRVMNRMILHYLTKNDDEYQVALASLNHQVSTELDLLRARLFRHSEMNLDDLLNGIFDV